MATYDLEEQEQLSELKAWWQQYGTLVVALLVAVAVGWAAVLIWKNHQREQAAEASNRFVAVQQAVSENDARKAREAAGELLDKYGSTTYAAMGALVSARLQAESGDARTAQAQLQWVVDESPDAQMRDLARLRLAGILFDQKAYDEALKRLAEEPGAGFAARYAELRGDILALQGKRAEARAAYEAALGKLNTTEKTAGLGRTGAPYREILQVKLDSMGGRS